MINLNYHHFQLKPIEELVGEQEGDFNINEEQEKRAGKAE